MYGCQNDVSAAEKQCASKECTVWEHATWTLNSGRYTFLEVSFVMSSSKISSTDGSPEVSSAGTTKKNMEGQMNEKEEVATGKVWGEKVKN